MPRKTLRDSDDEETIEGKGSQVSSAKPRKSRFDTDDIVDEIDSISDWKKKLLLRKRSDEVAADAEAKHRPDDIQKQHNPKIGDDGESKAEGSGSPLLRRGISKTDLIMSRAWTQMKFKMQGKVEVLCLWCTPHQRRGFHRKK
jgi:hypothetical protein